MSIDKAIRAIEDFQGSSLTKSLARIESEIVGYDSSSSHDFCNEHKVDNGFMDSALSIKNVAGQINVIIHAAGILNSLSAILEKEEIVESASLGAGNTGKRFDLETNIRVAEFKFIDWKGGSESIRQNGIFKDFYNLAEYKTSKKKILYVIGTHYPLKFFNGGRALTSVLSKQPAILDEINTNYKKTVKVVRDYYALHKSNVDICDVGQHIGRNP